ncbi:hypothetical protein KQH82_03680 [bacterium]|nr:hypothetical protein [bacterium]
MNARGRRGCPGGTGADPGAPRKWGRGGQIAVGSLAATVVGAVIRDVRKPDSVILGLAGAVRQKLLARREAKAALDLGDAVEVDITEINTAPTKRD